MATALVIATMDTKGQETLYIAGCLKDQGVSVCLMDAGIKGRSPAPVDVSREAVADAAGTTLAEVQAIRHEGKALKVMTTGAISRPGLPHSQRGHHSGPHRAKRN